MDNLDRDSVIVAQNSATAAAHIYASFGPTTWDKETYEQIRQDIFNGSMALAGVAGRTERTVEPRTVDPVQQLATIEQAFPGSTNVTGTPDATVSALRPKIIKQHSDLPEWFDAAYASSAVTPGEDLWDNRSDLPQFGGKRNAKSPWFKGADSGEGIWPPKVV